MGTALVIGGGANGLATAITLAQSGRPVSVLEARSELGGFCTLVDDTTTVQPWAVSELGLEVDWVDPHPIMVVGTDHRRSIQANDPALDAWRLHVDSFRDVIVELATQVAPDIRRQGSFRSLIPAVISGMKLGRTAGLELARIGPLAAEDWLDEWGIDRNTQAALILPALRGAWMGPRSPTSALAVLFHHALSGRRIEGGSEALVQALESRATQVGVSIRNDAKVAKIRVQQGRVVGVELADETTVDADEVVSTVGPSHTLLGLVPPADVPPSVYESIRNYRARGIVGQLSSPVSTPLFDGAKHVVVADDTVMLERAFDDAKHRRVPTRPALELFQSDGRIQVLMYGVPHALDGGWDASARARLQDSVASVLADCGHADVLDSDGTMLRTPMDLEREFGMWGGHLFHGEFALDQFLSFRPHPMFCGYQSGIEGLRLGGDGMHPSAGFTLVQGVLVGR